MDPASQVALDPVPGPPAYFEWNFTRWYRNAKDGYYRDRSGFLLHIAVWTDAHGPVLEGHHIHHADHDRAHNALANLRQVDAIEHWRHHESLRTGVWAESKTSAAGSARARALWAKRQPQPRVCVECGGDFLSTGMRAMLCSYECRRARSRKMEADTRARRRADGGG
jgi:hypothetical protein